MNMKILLLDRKIECLRENLQVLLLYNAPTSPQVIECSQELDKLLIEYEKLRYLYKLYRKENLKIA